jgi:hypothetical protein
MSPLLIMIKYSYKESKSGTILLGCTFYLVYKLKLGNQLPQVRYTALDPCLYQQGVTNQRSA